MEEEIKTQILMEEAGENIKPSSKIGLSLSFCVSDILRGLVNESEVMQIISGTYVENPKDWDEVISDYKKYYWYENPEEAEKIARRLISAGKIRQPRTEGKDVHNIVDGHWLDANKVEEWEKKQGWV